MQNRNQNKKHNCFSDLPIASLRKKKIAREEQKLRQLGYSDQRIKTIKKFLYALCHHVIKEELS